ncbi:hypothetical protein JK361_09975 [Streptomyces sp. 5-8]|uniref:Antirepressor protein ant N-terminal domain-containing protein n=1 Tax=Streptomyces musisoli TaxID=2802280 RepID=A0ABS1NYJ4_9ACTN|nr:phage antirepressor N-terminal domain-containing protein [Streptomyces musisoli]MBL1104917.1 hypothetical protein [Streptomyces musisoli]
MSAIAPLRPPATVQLSTGSLLSIPGEDGQSQIVFKPAVESIGLDYSGQLKRLRRQPWATVVITSMVAEDGKTREMVTVPEDTFIMWAATLQASRVAPELRPMLVAFQTESKKALHAYWTKGVAVRTQPEVRPLAPATRLTPTTFRQIYFSDVPEKRFFQHLYDHGYLLDQRNTRKDANGQYTKDGYRHGHPKAGKGDRYFQLPEDMYPVNGRPRGRAVVRPDRIQALVEQLIFEGLRHNPSITRGPSRLALTSSEVVDGRRFEIRRGA